MRPLPGRGRRRRRLGCGRRGLEYREEVALFTLAELDAMAATAGLQRVAATGGYGGETARRGRPVDPGLCQAGSIDEPAHAAGARNGGGGPVAAGR